MKWNEYLRESARFENKELTEGDLMDDAIFGLFGELGELCDLFKKVWFHGHPEDRDHILKECGDVLWYLALYCRHQDCGHFCTESRCLYGSPKAPMIFLMKNTSELVFGDSDMEQMNAMSVYTDIAAVANFYDSTIEEVMDMNLAKLSARYPDGFSTEKSLHRKEGDI